MRRARLRGLRAGVETERTARVLVVEDDPAILETVAYDLEREGHEVVKAGDGVSGLTPSREVEPDLIVLDLMLPRM